jgi:chitin disaccharide deacetylase
LIIVNADDFGRNKIATDSIVSCFLQGRITSTSAMVFLPDSQRAAELAREHEMDVGLHLNFTQDLTCAPANTRIRDFQARVASFLGKSNYHLIFYNPFLTNKFDYLFRTQLEEFERLYRAPPSHIDSHHHMHLCTNMLVNNPIPKGWWVRRNFFFSSIEKGLFNRWYRALIDMWVSKNYRITDYLFSLAESLRFNRLETIFKISKSTIVELQTHPELVDESAFLLDERFGKNLSNVKKVSFKGMLL